MTIKQILFSALILSTFNHTTFTNESSHESNPSIFLKYDVINFNDYKVESGINIITLNQENLRKLKEIGRENDFTVCNLTAANGFKTNINVYATRSPLLKEFNQCEIFAYVL